MACGLSVTCSQGMRLNNATIPPRRVEYYMLTKMADTLRGLKHLHRLRGPRLELSVYTALRRFTHRLLPEKV